MKKLFLAVIFFVLSVCAVFARTPYVNYSPNDPEKIYLFDAIVKVEKTGEIEVTENITLNARHEEINRGITRGLPNNIIERPHNFSLTMDGKEHPFFIEKEGGYLAVNFGNDDYISKGLHTYSLTYKCTGAIDFWEDYDELYWDVTGNDIPFVIDKARVKVIFPEGVKVKRRGISIYTGKEWEKEQNAEQVGNLVFETTKPLNPKEGFTVSIPFDKGVITPPFFIKLLHFFKKILPYLRLLLSVTIFILLVAYCAKSWYRYGRDPVLPGVTQYDPPKDVSPAFVCYQKRKGKGTSNVLTCIILDLAIKKYIKIEEKGKDITLYREKTDWQGLPEEEKMMMEKLFPVSHIRILNEKAGHALEYVKTRAVKEFQKKLRGFIKSNNKYMGKANLLLFALGVLPVLGDSIILLNIFLGFMLYVTFGVMFRSSKVLACLFGAFCVWLAANLSNYSLAFVLCEVIFVMGIFITALYVHLIPNLTDAGEEYFEYLKGFEKYIKTAEIYRVEESNPADAEKIFCDYLPYAFALGLSNVWMQKFTKIINNINVVENVGDIEDFSRISQRLDRKISSSMPVYHSSGGSSSWGSSDSSHSSGSYGGGHSGGGHGGGFIRGR